MFAPGELSLPVGIRQGGPINLPARRRAAKDIQIPHRPLQISPVVEVAIGSNHIGSPEAAGLISP
jgi:hypothetical protein